MASSGTKLIKERRIATVFVTPEIVASYVKGTPFGHFVSGLPDDAELYQVFWDQQRLAFGFHFVSKHFDQVPEGEIPGVLSVSVSTIYPEDLSLWQKLKWLFFSL